MIQSFRHKGLKLLFENGERRRVQPAYADKLERILARLEEASEASDMDLPGFRLHRLKGDLAGLWSVKRNRPDITARVEDELARPWSIST